jgi:hypothetical protein
MQCISNMSQLKILQSSVQKKKEKKKISKSDWYITIYVGVRTNASFSYRRHLVRKLKWTCPQEVGTASIRTG